MRTLTDWVIAAAVAFLLALAPMTSRAIEPGQTYCRENVCINRSQVIMLSNDLFDLNERAVYENIPQMVGEKKRLLAQLRADFTDAELFVLWNNPKARDTVRTGMPAAWAIMSEVMRDLAYEHRLDLSRTYKLDY